MSYGIEVIMIKRHIPDIIILVVILLVFIAMIVQLIPLLEDVIENREDESAVVANVDALGWRGPPALVGLAALQVIFPLVPAAAIGVLTGFAYGVAWGVLIFLGGIALGNIFVVYAMRKITVIFADRKKNEQKKKKRSGLLSKESLEGIKKPELVAFFLFMIPFISGAGPYLFAETKVNIWKYTLAVVAGSIPTAILYVFLGERISQGSHLTAIITAALLAAAIVFILIFRKKIISFILGGAASDSKPITTDINGE